MQMNQIAPQPPASPNYANVNYIGTPQASPTYHPGYHHGGSPYHFTQTQSQAQSSPPPSLAFVPSATTNTLATSNFTPLPPQQQTMDPEKSRSITSTVEGVVPGVSRLLYHGYASERVNCMYCIRGTLQPWTCACLPSVQSELVKGRYVQVYDNKLEINEPDSCMVGFGTCVVRDRISTIHFDRALAQNASKAEGCGPHFSHGDCCPSCFGLYGETLVLHTDRAHCCALCNNCCRTVNTSSSVRCSNSGCQYAIGDVFSYPPFSCFPCFPQHKLVFGMENVNDLAAKINAARTLKGPAAPRAQPPF